MIQDVNNSKALCQRSEQNDGDMRKHQIGENVSRKDKINFLVATVSINGQISSFFSWGFKFNFKGDV